MDKGGWTGGGANKSGLRLILNCNFLECIVVIPFKHKKRQRKNSSRRYVVNEMEGLHPNSYRCMLVPNLNTVDNTDNSNIFISEKRTNNS